MKIWQLLLNNGGCRLPCYWGITPGQTTVDEFIQFVNQFPEEAEWMDKENGFYTFYYVAPLDIDYTSTVIFFYENMLIQGIGIKQETARLSFPLTRLLSEYGMLDKVLLDSFESRYRMFVLYEEQRIVGQYYLYAKYDYICYDSTYNPGIVTWAKGIHWLTYVNRLFGDYTDPVSESSLRYLDQVTEYDMETFYKQFSTKNRDICMKTLLTNP